MPIPIEDLVGAINPKNTTLLLGAGSSIPSGAPSAADLASAIIAEIKNPDLTEATLIDAAGIFELKFGRRALVDLVAGKLVHIKPAGGILNLPRFEWQSIYTTNYDTLIEQSYRRASKEISIIRGNADFREGTSSATPLLKIHGCITQDISLGSQYRLVLTEVDYAEHEKYREIMFERLSYDMMKNDVVIIGHSLSDEGIRDTVNRTINIKAKRGAPGKVYMLIYVRNIDRAMLLEQRGLKVAFGALDEFVDKLWVRAPNIVPVATSDDDPITAAAQLQTRLVDVAHAATLIPDPFRMFNGRAASHADVAANLCFERTLANRIRDEIDEGRYRIVSVIGPAGVGKTTLCRLICDGLRKRGFFAWEHKYDAYFEAKDWILVAEKLKRIGSPGVLFVDECHREMRQLNLLCDYIGSNVSCPLHIVVCSPSAQWRPRVKSKYYFAPGIGSSFWIDHLDQSEIHGLLGLVDSNSTIRSMVRDAFLRQPYQRRYEQLRNRCSADMFVCLKNIFATEKIDDILLREYADMAEPLQDVYRHVAAMESLNVKAHRQLILRCTSVSAGSVFALLEDLKGIIEEYDINESMGLYGWETRHLVIAQLIAGYKFSDQAELEQLIGRVIENLNPAIDYRTKVRYWTMRPGLWNRTPSLPRCAKPALQAVNRACTYGTRTKASLDRQSLEHRQT